ncbi:hypothetical protein ACA910_021369 [Epithemia clementina (nom. ined.)]
MKSALCVRSSIVVWLYLIGLIVPTSVSGRKSLPTVPSSPSSSRQQRVLSLISSSSSSSSLSAAARTRTTSDVIVSLQHGLATCTNEENKEESAETKSPELPPQHVGYGVDTAINIASRHRGGGGSAINVPMMDPTLTKALLGVALLAVLEAVTKKVLQSLDVKFPAMLAACLALFVFLVVTDALVSASAARGMAEFLAPGAALLAKWLPMFFVPGLALLPLAPSVGGTVEILKVISVVVLGLLYTIFTVGTAVMALRGVGGASAVHNNGLTKKRRFQRVKVPSVSQSIKKARILPFTEQQVQSFGTLAIVTGILTYITSASKHSWAKPCETSFLTFFTVATYMWAARLPASFVAAVHPLVTTCLLILAMVRGLSVVTNRSFTSILQGYKVGSLQWNKAGSGDVLLYLLGPSAVSFAISMYSKRVLLSKNLLVVVTAVLVSSVGGLFGTAAFVRAIQLGGKSLNARTVRLSVLSRNVTTALALALTNMMGGDLSIAAAVVCLTGVMGATYGKAILEFWGITDPITRGLCIGSSAQGLGVASMADEPDAFSFAAMAMVLTALTSTTLVTFPAIKQALLKLATGSKI